MEYFIHQFRYKKGIVSARNLSLPSLIDSLKKEKSGQPVTLARNSLINSFPGHRNQHIKRLPINIFGATFKRLDSEGEFKRYNGLVLLEVDQLANKEEVVRIRKQASAMPQTLLAFTGSSGRSVKIVVRFIRPDESLPQEEEKAEMFHKEAYKTAVKFYLPQLERNITLKEPDLSHGCRMSYDPDLYYNQEADAIRIEQPAWKNSTTEEICIPLQAPQHYLDRLMPGLERNRQIRRLYMLCLQETLRLQQTEPRVSIQQMMIQLAKNCFVSGIPEEEAIQCTRMYGELMPEENEIRTLFHTTYLLKKGFGNRPALPKSMILTFELEEFLNRRYLFRRNMMSGGIEYRDKSLVRFDFRDITREAQHTICMEARKEGLDVWDKDITRHIYSEKIAAFHPIEEYLNYLPEWDGKDYVRDLANRIPNTNPVWSDLFYRWMLSMVAHWLDWEHTHANTTTPLLVGGQGCGKSTFCLHILPPELRHYYTDSIDFSKRRDTELALHRYALINIDEFDMVKESQQSYLKHILQKTVVNTRLPYRTTQSCLRRYATFIATSNNFDLLADPTGSRRFLCVEVKGMIDNSQPIPYEKLYAQILHALKHKERFWLTHEEEQEMINQNLRFQQICEEEEYLFSYFSVPEEGEPGEYLLAIEILDRIQHRNPHFKYSSSSVRRLGRVLAKHKFPVKRLRKGNCYFIKENN